MCSTCVSRRSGMIVMRGFSRTGIGIMTLLRGSSVETGIGAGSAVDVTVALRTGALSSGQSDTAQFGFDTGDVAVGGATVQYDPMGKQVSVARGLAGVSTDVWGGAMMRTSHYCCARQDSPSNCK